MKISLVIPAYNEEKLLPQTLNSITSLNRKPDEIILVNAQSTDKTAAIAEAFGCRVITVPKTTIGFSRQIGIEEANGDIIAFTDADTILPKTWLTDITTMLEKQGVVGVFGGFRVKDGPWWYKLFINAIQPVTNSIWWALLRIPFATGQNMAFYKKKALKAGGIPKNFKIAEDIEIARRLMKVGKIIFRQDFFVIASGRRGFEGFGKLISRTFQAFTYYFIFRRANKTDFPAIR